jgi:hypothetical protein
MNLRRRRRHSLHRRYTQWKTEQKNFLMNNHDESIFGKLEYQTCKTCQQKLGTMNIPLMQEQINQLDAELKDVIFTESMFQTMNNSIHQLFSSKYMCILMAWIPIILGSTRFLWLHITRI